MNIAEIMARPTNELTHEEIVWLSNNYKNGEQRNKLKEYFSSKSIAMSRCKRDCHTIVFSTPGETGTSYFRCFEPLLSFFRTCDDFNLIYTERLEPWHYMLADLMVQHRASENHSLTHKLLDYWPQDKIKPVVIHNVDDNEFKLPKHHPMFELWYAQKKDEMSLYTIRRSDFVEITTRKLKQTMLDVNPNVHISRNMFNFKLPQWSLERQKDYDYDFFGRTKNEQYTPFEFFKNYSSQDIVIGWSGLTSHFADLKRMKPILKAIHDKHPNTKFILAGMALRDNHYIISLSPDGKQLTSDAPLVDLEATYLRRVTKLFNDFDPDRLKIYDALNLEDYGWFAALFDIGLAYIEHNSFNSNKCLVAGSLVATSDGIIPIEKIKPNTCKTASGDNIVANINYQDERCVTLVTESGYEISGTISHRIKNVHGTWTNLDEFSVGDDITISPYEIVQNNYQHLSFPMLNNKYGSVNIEDGVNFSIIDVDSLPNIKINENWAELFGLFIGDGHMANSVGISIAFNSKDVSAIEHTEELIAKLGMRSSRKTDARWDCNCTYVSLNSNALQRLMYYYGMFHAGDGFQTLTKTLEVPEFILKSPKSVIRSFIRGLFEADADVCAEGTTLEFSTKSKEFARQIQFLLLGFGIKSHKKTKVIYGNDYYTINLSNFAREIGFISKFKNDRLDLNDEKIIRNTKDWSWTEKIVSKEYSMNDVYDVEVENTHEYNANGFVSHNSEVKAVEYARYGAIPLMSYYGGYTDFYDNFIKAKFGAPELICRTELQSDWIAKLDYLVTNIRSDKTIKTKTALLEFVNDKYDIDTNIGRRIGWYQDLIETNIDRESARVVRDNFVIRFPDEVNAEKLTTTLDDMES